MFRLSALYRYPIKSSAAESLERVALDALGVVGDRRWMAVDTETGRFFTQRLLPQLGRIQARWAAPEVLRLNAPGMSELSLEVPAADANLRGVTVWRDTLQAPDAGDAAADWLTRFLGRPTRLVHIPEARARQVDTGYAEPGQKVHFADGFPLLLIGQASLDDLSQRVGRPLEMLRFRPNLVVEGSAAFAEDGWKRIRIGSVEFVVAKPCSRCILTTLDPATGERNELFYEGRGIFACVSPWNFPLAIFLGQISAALVAGNTVLAKPAEQTSLIAARTVELMFEAGLPKDVIALLPGDGATLGGVFCRDARVAGVAFTGSTDTARIINRQLAEKPGAIATLIAETGGQNAMIVDSTALPEQVIKDAVQSAFTSAGQRCSALRVMYVQQDIAERVIELLKGAMAELKVGPTDVRVSDVGPVIDAEAKAGLEQHIAALKAAGKLIAETKVPGNLNGHFVAPVAFEISGIDELKKENFGPVLHVVRYAAQDLEKVVQAINATGFGLTMGVHSRNEETARRIEELARVGNLYINRNQIGAVVGVQPFGGHGLSGTGPKAGGPNYLLRFVSERTTSVNTTAVGGNASLLSLADAE
ncbi:MAG: L-glutamate gamma-semialdehyde dehydrogenase [Pseudomonas aeruginosa]|nr:L-glutamate gamma-semialdehyde dehydrogenase [Pseudomonas aeruginosa]